MELEFSVERFLQEKVKLEIKKLYLPHLFFLEEMLSSGAITQEDFDKKRKAVLDMGNACSRSINEQILLTLDNIFGGPQNFRITARFKDKH